MICHAFTEEQVEAMRASAVARAVLAERERIAREIDQAWAVANEAGDSHDYLGGLALAERIARGQTSEYR